MYEPRVQFQQDRQTHTHTHTHTDTPPKSTREFISVSFCFEVCTFIVLCISISGTFFFVACEMFCFGILLKLQVLRILLQFVSAIKFWQFLVRLVSRVDFWFGPLLPYKVSISLDLVVMVSELSCFLVFYLMPYLVSVISVIQKTQCHINAAQMFTLVRLNKVLV